MQQSQRGPARAGRANLPCGGLGPCPTLTCDDQLRVEEAGVLIQLVVVDVAGIGIHLWMSQRLGSRCCLQPHGPLHRSMPN